MAPLAEKVAIAVSLAAPQERRALPATVTGASRGIGRAIALKLAGNGASVVVNYAGNADKAQEVVADIGLEYKQLHSKPMSAK